MKDVNSCADDLAEYARARGGLIAEVPRSPARASARQEDPPQEKPPDVDEDPRRYRSAPLYAWCKTYPEWGVGRLIWLTRLLSGRQIAQLRFEGGVNTVPFESLEFVDFAQTKSPQEWAQRFVRAARDALVDADYERAQQLLTYARSFRPQDPGLLRLSMLAALRASDYERARSFVEQWRGVEGDRPSINRYASLIAEQRGDLAEAAAFAWSVAGATGTAQDWMRSARLAVRTRNLAQAAEALDRALDEEERFEWRLQAADVARMLGLSETELRHALRLVELDPASEIAIGRLVQVLVDAGRTEEALNRCEEAAERLDSSRLRAHLSELRHNGEKSTSASRDPAGSEPEPTDAPRSVTREATEAPPRILNGQYALPTTYREGGMARVYRATDLHNDNKLVAVKILNTTSGDIAVANLSAQRECDALFRLRHPNIVSLLDAGRDQQTNNRYLVFDWFDESLPDVLASRGAVAWDEFFSRWGRPILEGLSHAHSRGIAHRDIKPSNILIFSDGAPLIADFGIAKLTHEVALGRTMVDHRSPPYAPPEYDSGPHTLTRDVYGFAVLALLMVAGVDPYSDAFEDPHDAVPAALEDADLPDEVRSYWRSCLGPPEDRPIDATVALAQLERLQAARRPVDEDSKEHRRHVVPVVLSNKALRELAIEFGASEQSNAESLVADEFAGEWHAAPLPDFSEESSSAGHYHLLGTELRLHVMVHDRSDRLLAVGAKRVGDVRLARERERTWRATGFRLAIGDPSDAGASAAAIHLFEEGVALEASHAARESPSDRSALIETWRKTLRALRSLEKSRQEPVAYSAVRATGVGATFTLVDTPPVNIAGTTRVAEMTERGFLRGEVVGVKGNEITLRVLDGDIAQLPPRGTLRIDTALEAINIRRQYDALDSVEAGEAARTDLLDLLTQSGKSRSPTDVGELNWCQPDLDDDKRRATRLALGTRDLLHVEGPPGTGKTKFITETILQAIRRDPSKRILLSSQTHAALDNVIERLAEKDDTVRIVRVGRQDDDRVSQEARPHLVRPVLTRWQRQVEKKGRSFLRDWARERGLNPRDVEIAALHEEIAAARRTQSDTEFELAALNEEIEATRARQREQPTTDQTHGVGILQDHRRSLEEAISDAEVCADRALAQLKKLGAIATTRELEGLSPDALDALADALVSSDAPDVDQCKDLIALLGEWHSTFGHGPQFEAAALMRAQVVAATCVGLGGIRGVEAIDFDLCIIDEASKATATELLIPMTRAERWVLVGDSRQLPPFLDSDLDRQVLAEHGLTEEDVKATLFADLAERLPESSRVSLSRQYRMVPEIGDLISACFYDGRLRSEPRPERRWLCDAVGGKPVVWLTTSQDRLRREAPAGTTFVNPVEARAVREALSRINLVASGREELLHVAVIAGYLAQVQEIETAIAERRARWDALRVEVATVDSFQGREADIVVYSVVRSNTEKKIGFLREPPRLNVALSRGRELLVIIGDHQFARSARGRNPFVPVLRYIDEHPADCALTRVP